MKKSILLLFAALFPLVASAQTKVEIDGIWYNLVSKAKQAEVTYKGDDPYQGGWYSDSITIPATVTHNGVAYSVTSIGDYAFDDCTNLTAITIPESVTSIGRYTFWDCSSLNAVHISSIEAWCEISFHNYSSNPLYYAHNLYLDGELVTELVIPSSVTSIGGSAFSGCSSLTAITIPEGVTSIGDWAFCDCSSLTAITIPESVTSIGNYAFQYCSSLTAITIPESVTSIGYYAFYDCSSLTAITIPEGVTSIGFSAFEGCSSLTDITIPEGVTSIGERVFAYCSNLTSITIPESVTSIGGWAFEDCSSLTALSIPASVTSIGGAAFAGCSSLTDITIPEGVTSIGDAAFNGCSSLTAINIPEGVTSIGDYAFDDCSSLKSITIPEGVTSIGYDAFKGCSSLTTIVLPKSVSSIGNEAFANCSELTDVYCYAKTVPSTYSNAFDGSYIEYATLHVPTSAINSYRSTAPWSGFGKFETTSIAVGRITLSRSSATLTEGEEMTLTATVEPDDAADTSVTWSSSNPSVATVDNTGKVTAIAPGTATITATANDGSGVSASCEVTVQELILGKCATPVISYVDGKVVFACDTEGAIVKSSFKDNSASDYNDMEVAFIPTYTLTAYATKEHYENSDPVTLTLCWVPCDEEHEKGDADGILTIPAKPVLISTQGGTITLSGLAEGTEVAVVTTGGTAVATAIATNGTATLTTGLEAGSIAIVKIGNYSIKVAIK